MSFAPGAKLGPYEIVGSLGAGGMGEVYRARDARLGRDVAIKCLPDAFAADPDRLMRFEREARTLASLNHPHIAQVFGLEESAATRALVMELVEGEDLSARIARGPIPLDEALPIARQIAEALEAAHSIGIIHRDLKPANIKVRDDGTVKVLDFGLAKALDSSASSGANELINSPTITSPAMTMRGVILGTAAYMSPEQAKGKLVDKRADVWAFGCVLYEMLTGKRAFEGEDVTDTLAAILRSDPDWSAVASLPPVLQMLLKRCIDRDSRRRIGDISAVRFVLDDPTVFAPTPSVVAPQPPTAAPPSGRGFFSVPTLLALVSVAAIAAAATWAIASRRPPLPAAAVTRFTVPLPQGLVVAMSRRMATLSTEGQALAFVSEGQIVVRRFERFAAEPIAASDLGQGITSPTFSPDGAWIAFHSGLQSAVKKVSIRGGAAVRVCDSPVPLTISWEAGGILLGMGEGGVTRCNPAGGKAEKIAAAAEGEAILGAQFLGTDAVLYTVSKSGDAGAARWETAQIVMQSLKSGERRVLINGGSDGRVTPTGHLVYWSAGIVYAAPFDRTTLQVRGEPTPVVEGVMRTSTGPTQMAMSQSGTLVYMPGPAGNTMGDRQLAITDRGGQISRVSLPAGPYVQVRAAPNGTEVALASDDGKDASVWVYALDGKTAARRLTLSGRNRAPVWSPDGRWIAFQSDREGDLAIYRQHADGSGTPERLTTAAKGEAHTPESWSPDGRHLSYAVLGSTPRGQSTLWSLSLADKKATPFNGVTSLEPLGSVFSPDGKWIAYSRANSADISFANRGVFVQPFPPTDTVLQAPRQIVDFHPVWSPDGKELIFLASTTARVMAAMKVTSSGGTLVFSTPSRFPATVTGDKLSAEPRSFDILPDGRFIGLVGPTDNANSTGFAELRIVVNWFEELKQRVK